MCPYLSALHAQTGQRIDQIITFGPDDTEFAINFTVVCDLIPNESFVWTLTLVSLIDRVTIEPFNTTTIHIIDNDGETTLFFNW